MRIETPSNEENLAEIVRDACAGSTALEIRGGGGALTVGRPVQADATLSIAGLSGVPLYDPGALTLVARAGEPLSALERMLEAENQRLAFEPMDFRPLLASGGDEPTIGAVVAANNSGPRRVQAGACRDSLLGVRFVDGRGRILKNGGRVMKNVTGYDLAKLICGAYGTLGALTEVAFKLLPKPERAACLTIRGLTDARAVEALSAALGAPYEVNGAAHLPADCARGEGEAVTMLRIEGFDANIAHRAPALRALLAAYGDVEIAEDPDQIAADWSYVRDAKPFVGAPGAVWRLSVKPSDAPGVVETIRRSLSVRAFYDWGGGRVWLLAPEEADAGARVIRAAVDAQGGHATLIRAAETVRASVPVFHPEAPRLAALSAQMRREFDPADILNPGRVAAPTA